MLDLLLNNRLFGTFTTGQKSKMACIEVIMLQLNLREYSWYDPMMRSFSLAGHAGKNSGGASCCPAFSFC
jgi:hypothetical protein